MVTMDSKISIIILFPLFLLSSSLFSSGTGEQTRLQDAEKPAIKWEFISKDITGNRKVLQYTEIFDITPENQYKITFKTAAPVYVYIFIYDTKENVNVLFPENVNQYRDSLKAETIYSIPADHNQWQSLSYDTLINNFYIIAAFQKQKKLETLIKEYLAVLQSDKTHVNQKEAVKNALLQEIIKREIRRNENPRCLFCEFDRSLILAVP